MEGTLVVSAAAQLHRTGIDATEDGSSTEPLCQPQRKYINGYGILQSLPVLLRRHHHSVHHKTRQVNSIRLVYP
jgi:hypothetical protein